MKSLVRDYTFDASSKTVTFTNISSIGLEQILLITNVKDNIIIYSFADNALGGTVSGNVLTLTYNTASMSDTDELQIFIDSDDLEENLVGWLRYILKSTSYARDAGDRMRVIMDNNPMLYSYMRNSTTSMVGGTESWYSISSNSTVDAREQLMELSNIAVISSMQRWRSQ